MVSLYSFTTFPFERYTRPPRTPSLAISPEGRRHRIKRFSSLPRRYGLKTATCPRTAWFAMIETSRLLRVRAGVVQTGSGMAKQEHIASSIALNDATNGV